MAYIDEAYYTGKFKGTALADPSSFDRLAEIASDLIDGMVNIPVNTLDPDSDSYAKVQRACAFLVETIDANGGIDAITGVSASVGAGGSETLGDYSISAGAGESSRTGAATWFGDARNIVLLLLRAAGLMSRWAYAGTVIDNGI